MYYNCAMERDATLILRLPSAVKDALAQAAKDDLRSMSGMAMRVLSDWLTSNGYLPKQPGPPARARKGGK